MLSSSELLVSPASDELPDPSLDSAASAAESSSSSSWSELAASLTSELPPSGELASSDAEPGLERAPPLEASAPAEGLD